MRAYHDLGGLPGGPIDRHEHDALLWEKRVHAMLNLLAEQKVITVDELRYGIETLGEAEYARLTYYERWIESITRALVHRGVLTTEELGAKLADVEAREAQSS
ncbi:MAG: nitrile hydratase beta subunit protein [Armatimonadetes bacterium]|nr:nitrile hydratase beta subunit protein [Armatimonadota bacterium]